MAHRLHSSENTLIHGISVNKHQFLLQLLQIFLVGLTIGMIRVVVPGLAESEFGLANKAFFLLASFVVVFGVIKAVMNLFAGKLSEQYGRKTVLIWGWLVALPVPFILLYAPNWNWIIFATVLLGFNQGLAWSMALNSKLDLAKSTQKGLVNGVNEFSGYAAVGIAGLVTAYFVEWFGAKEGLFIFSLSVILLGLVLAKWTIKETLPWAALHHEMASKAGEEHAEKSLKQLFKMASWENGSLVAINQAGLIEKFTDAIVWIFLPVYFLSQGISLIEAGAIVAVYGVVWGGSQLVTGPLSDKIGRKGLIVWGMWLCGLGVLSIPMTQGVTLWSIEAAVIGLGMAMLYPNLGAAVGDYAPVAHRASLIGIYRFWRDSGYAFGALAMGILAQWSQDLSTPFWLVGIAMLLSGAWVQIKITK
ncbi:MFS transporter [Hydrogenovibrio crunogenus]|uniref:MFS transporter n=1 Tax=Hydrogenovibrio crunogenus TaxID=39765 RepID=A0A4P7NWM5_9GAMM|nr:MFS transporter [Hydrogenovibrio crunogenus]QBZ82057.1 MFS transporter [Hydrogenovibrio crunogenus]